MRVFPPSPSRWSLAVAGVVLAGSLAALPTAARAEEGGPVGTGDTIVGELVQGYADPGPSEGAHPEPEDDGSGLLSWVQTAPGEAVRVPTADLAGADAGDTVEVTVGATVQDEASAEGLEPARDVLAAEVVAAAEEPAPAATTGPANHLVTVVMMRPGGVARDSTTLAQVQAAVSGPVADFWAEQSDGDVRFGVAAGVDWTTSTATCRDPFKLWNDAALAAGWRSGPGKHLLVYVPARTPDCSYGLGTVGRGLDDGGVAYVQATETSVIAHEFGHHFGLGHSSEIQCDGAVDSGACRVAPYNDLYDVMGFSWGQVGTLNAPQASRLGLLRAGEWAVVTPWSAPASYTLVPVSAATGTRALELIGPDGGRRWLEYRQAGGRDAWLGTPAGGGLESGVTLRLAADQPDTSLLLDGTPGTPARVSDLQVTLPLNTPVRVWGGEVTLTVQALTDGAASVRVAPGGSPVGQRYVATGGAAGPLGAPTGPLVCGLRGGGCLRAFQNGSIYWSPATGAQVVTGVSRDRWAAQGWEGGALGYPVTDTVCGLRDGGCYQHFQGGTVMSGPAGAWALSGGLRDGWFARGSEGGALGYPAAAAVCGLRSGGCLQRFAGGTLYWSAVTGARAVTGPTADGWARQGWETGPLGYPVTDTVCGLRDGGCYQHFQGGSVMSSPATGSWPVSGGLRDGWFRTGSERGTLGYPTAAPVCGLRDGGCLQRFERGNLYWSAATGARAVIGPAGEAWARQGWERGALGYPVSDTSCGLRDGGCYQHFQGGSVMYSPATGSWALSGPLRDGWFRAGSEGGVLGYPTAAAVCGLREGGCLQRFAGGSLYWSPATGAFPVRAGAIADRWGSLGWERGMGYPLEAERVVPGGRAQRFQGGTLTLSTTTGEVRRS